MRNYVEMFATSWDLVNSVIGTVPLFAFGGDESEIQIEFDARNTKTVAGLPDESFTITNQVGPSKIFVLLDKEILVRYFNGAPLTAGDGSQSITGPLYAFSVGVVPTSQLWPMVYDSPRKTGWVNVFTGYRHKAQK